MENAVGHTLVLFGIKRVHSKRVENAEKRYGVFHELFHQFPFSWIIHVQSEQKLLEYITKV